MKAVLSSRIYLTCETGSDLERKLVTHLRYEISRQPISPYPEIINNVTRVTPAIVSIPAGREDLIPNDYEIVDKRAKVPAIFPPFKATLRPDQQKAVDFLGSNGLIEAQPGYGKTIVGLALAVKHGQKTLVVTTTTMIRDMWVQEVKKLFGFTPGIIGSGKFSTKEPIVIANIQTLRNRITELQDTFGTVIVDEVHRAPADTFVKVLNLMRPTYRIGLSGTLVRKDGLHIVLPDYFGKARFIGAAENTMLPEAHLYKSQIELTGNEFIPWSVKINNLLSNPKYLQECADLIKVYIDAGHKVLVVADRTAFLEHLHVLFKEDSFLITGAIKGAELRQKIMSAVTDFPRGCALFSTQSIFSEGVSLNCLSALLLGTPVNNEPLLKQLIGRVIREDKNKLTPVVIDINLAGNTGKNHANERKKSYISWGLKIKALN